MYCPSCGASNNDDQLACQSCGLPLGRGAQAPLPPGAGPGPGWSAASPEGQPGNQVPPGYQPPPGYQQPGYQKPGYQQPGYQQPGYVPPGGVPPYQQQYQQQDWQGSYPSYAGFWKRFVAYILDGILINIVMTIIGFALGVGYVNGFNNAATGRSAAYSLVALVLTWLYFALMESSSLQATLGKMALGIVVTDINGNRIGFGRATGRYFGKIVSAFILLIGFIMAGFTEQKRALHDFMAGTLVINKR